MSSYSRSYISSLLFSFLVSPFFTRPEDLSKCMEDGSHVSKAAYRLLSASLGFIQVITGCTRHLELEGGGKSLQASESF